MRFPLPGGHATDSRAYTPAAPADAPTSRVRTRETANVLMTGEQQLLEALPDGALDEATKRLG
ncbi:hypothetical protein [Streptomyces roseoverticillatus]|uniref:Uncharacterized protein n=1 Tax=Streptomyces roseoverticillatus TaxID=66429 RepID=A0ABV3J557_9ACTN